MPSNLLSGSGVKMFFMLSMNQNSVMEELCYGAKLPIFSVNLIIFVRESPAWGVRLMNETMKILILNGPNLNLQGRRDTGVYGSQTFESYFEALKANYPSVEFGYFQSNIEGELIDAVQQADGVYDGVVINAGGPCRPCRFPSSRCTSPRSSPARSSATPRCWLPWPRGRSWGSA